MQAFIKERLAVGATVFPAQPLRALALTPLAQVRVVILGQDPYHGPGQADGLAFSVPQGQKKIPPSLRNMFQELRRGFDAQVAKSAQGGIGAATARGVQGAQGVQGVQGEHRGVGDAAIRNGSLAGWAAQGVLLLNTCLTVEQGLPASHAGRGWEMLTDAIVGAVAARAAPVVFVLWGAKAQARLPVIARARALLQTPGATASEASPCLVLTANHPSPLSALRQPRPFVGCGHFEQANRFLAQHSGQGIVW